MAAAMFMDEPRRGEFALFQRGPHASDHLTVHPAGGAALEDLPLATAAEVTQAAQRARAAQHAWGSMPPYFRLTALRRVPDLLDAYRGMAATVLRGETALTAQAADDRVLEAAQECRKVTGSGLKALHPVKERSGLRVRAVRHREPVGLIGVIAGPVNSFDPVTAVAALLAGNALVIVPKGTPGYGARLLAQLCDAARLPQDLVQAAVGATGLATSLLAEVDHLVLPDDEPGRKLSELAAERGIGRTTNGSADPADFTRLTG